MKLILLGLCVLVAAGIFATILLATWASHRAAAQSLSPARSLVAELLWAAIPCLMIVAAATPAVIRAAGLNRGEAREALKIAVLPAGSARGP